MPRRAGRHALAFIFVTALMAQVQGGLIRAAGLFTAGAPRIYFPGAPFVVAAALTLVCVIQFARVMRRTPAPDPEGIPGLAGNP